MYTEGVKLTSAFRQFYRGGDMPVVQISVPEGSLTEEQKQRMVAGVTDVMVEVEGIPHVRAGTVVLVSDIPDGGWGIGGKAWTLADLGARLAKADG
jgi:4-oxalocrotonate tautomerase